MRFETHPAFPGGRTLPVGRRFRIVPGSSEVAGDDGRIPLRLSRGRAFGSGLHETTTSCLEVLETLGLHRCRWVLDIGTGTGILALAALLLGAGRAAALDIDRESVDTCRKNAVLNGLGERLHLYLGTIDALNPGFRPDLVVANIHADVVLRKTGRLSELLDDGGTLVLSGLDYADSMEVKAAMGRRGLESASVVFLKDYVTQVWRRPPGRVRKGP